MSEETVENKFIFTTEGRNSLISQLGGIRFAILGAVLVHGLEPLAVDAHKDLTLDSLTSMPGVILGLKNVNYISSGNKGLSPENNYVYLEAIHNITNNLIPLHYIPAAEVVDSDSSTYGNYELEIDKTLINWDNKNDIAFEHIIFIGKQYAQTDDATYNVEKTQKPVLVAIGNIEGLELLAEQNEYVNSKLRIRLTLSEKDDNIEADLDLTNPDTQEVLAIADKMSLVNNGVKTVTTAFSITDNKQIVDDFKLNPDGAVAMTKTLMVAEPYDANELENDFNGVGLLHLINAKDAVREYTPQVVLITFDHIERDNNSDPISPINAYNVEFLLRASGDQNVTGNALDDGYDLPHEDVNYNTSTYGTDSTGTENKFFNYDYSGYLPPIFKIGSLPADDVLAVEIFGVGNKILNTNDRLLFSNNNITQGSYVDSRKENVLIASNDNFIDIMNGSNLLLGSELNAIKGWSVENSIINSYYNILGHDAYNVNIIGSLENYINTNLSYAALEGGDIFIANSNNNRIDNIFSAALLNSNNNEITKSNQVTLLNTNLFNVDEANSFVGINASSCSVNNDANLNVIINGFNNYISDSNSVTMIGHHLTANRANLYNDNSYDPIIVLGRYNGFDVMNSNHDDNGFVNNMIPGIIYGYGDGTSQCYKQNVLEFYPQNGLLRLYNKQTKKWSEIGGDAGLKIPNDNIEAKSLTVKDSIKFGNNNITRKMISIDNGDYGPSISVKTTPDGTLNSAKTSTITDENIKVADATTNEYVEINKNSINFYNANKLVTKIDKDSHYQKARADIAIKAKTNMAQAGFECSVLSYHGPKAIGDWIRKIWELAPPFAYTTNNTAATNNAIYSIYTSNVWTKATNRTTFESFVTTYIGSNTCLVSDNNTETKYISYIDSDIIKNELDLDELEINLFVDDYEGYDMHLLWALDRRILGNTSPLINTEIKLNVFINSCAYSNDEGENLHFWSFNKNGGAYRNVDMSSYDRFTTLIAKPGSLKLYQSTPVGWWRMN